MNRVIKKSFERKQKVTVLMLCAVCTLFCWSCQNRNEADQPLPEPLSDEEISFNLSENGKTDPDLLIGEWDAIAFAYTVDGKRISNRTAISKGRLKIPVAITVIDDDGKGLWELSVVNTSMYACSLSGNLIELTFCRSTYIYVPPLHIENDLTIALVTACSFVIKGNELIIYFTKVEDKDLLPNCLVIENKNLLIFKKR